MITYLDGIVTHKEPTRVWLDLNGVGYELLIPLSTYERLPRLKERVKLLTHFHVREDAQTLYGFYSSDEKELFLKLIAISGIGPKMAITILSGASPAQFKSRIVAGDVKALTLIPGIGQKTAQRIIVELREKFSGADEPLPDGFDALFSGSISDEALKALKALLSLGYRRAEALNALKKASQELGTDTSVEAILKSALNNM
ncbi:Holliday junction branch migration protein RuvA [bacterium]|nr:Holliday junction branch migration protein RuvA [bacterium]MBU1633873.1 Holliday junction branch migration protein RuvA [bacterium]MBU1872960.1 Holliday junction branch migration protein RuvA [bacterium]